MNPSKKLLSVFSAAAVILAMAGFTHAQSAAIPKETIAGLESAWTATKGESSASRKRLAMKRVLRDAADLVEKNPAAPNRFDVLALLLRSQQSLLGMDDSRALREEVLETCRKLSEAPDAYADVRLNADILLNQTEMARTGADAKERMQGLMRLLDRYRGTPADGKFLQTATLLALEQGDSITIEKLRNEMEQRFAGDLEMIIFMSEKLGGEIFGAPFSGVFKSADGRVWCYPMDAMGRTTMLYFWSTRDNGEADLEVLAKTWQEHKQAYAHRVEMISVNLDELPDAGASILRKNGLEWNALHLPGGEKSKVFQAYGRPYPALLTITPTGYCALIKSDVLRKPVSSEKPRDYTRSLGSALAREWSEPPYIAQIASLLAGEFFVVDASTPFDPSAPPELRMVSPDAKIERNAQCVPEETLRAIQDGFIAPPLRFMTPATEVRAKFEAVVKSCKEVIASHPQAPDLWIVRNRLIVALQGLAKLDPTTNHLSQAVEVAKAAIAAPHPAGTDVIARLCLARQSLRDTAVLKQRDASGLFLQQAGKPSGADITAAALLALEVGNPRDFEQHRKTILKDHAGNPAMTSFVNYLLDRDHRHSLFLPPYTGGRVPGYRQGYATSRGAPDEARRTFQATLLPTLDGGTMQIPDSKAAKWTVVVFASPWPTERGKSGSPNPEGVVNSLALMAESRKFGDVQVILAILDGDAAKTKEMIGKRLIKCPVALVPGGLSHPLAGSLGLFDTRNFLHAVVIRPDGSIAGSNRMNIPNAVANLIAWQDEKNVADAIAKGDLETAKRIAFTLAPLEPPTVTDAKGNVRTLPMPKINIHHLLARTKVYVAMEQWKPALTDAEAAFSEIAGTAGSISIRTPELEEVEALRDSIRKHLSPDKVK